MSKLDFQQQRERDEYFKRQELQAARLGNKDYEKGGEHKKSLKGYDGKLMPSDYLKLKSSHVEMKKIIAVQDREVKIKMEQAKKDYLKKYGPDALRRKLEQYYHPTN
jgi:hypothetical protein